MSSAKARGGEASAGGSSPGSRKPATAGSAGAGAGAGAGTHPQAPQHRQPASHAAGGAMPAAGPPRHSDGRRGAGTPTSSQASGAPPSRSGGSGWRGSSAETRMSSDPGLGSSVNLYDRARAMQMQQMQAQFPQYGQPGPPQRRVGSAGSARPMPVASGVPVASAPMPAGHPHQAGPQPHYSRAPAYAQQHSAAPQYGQPAAGPAYGAGTYAQHATPAQAAPVYPASPGRGIRSSGATHATSHQLPGSNSQYVGCASTVQRCVCDAASSVVHLCTLVRVPSQLHRRRHPGILSSKSAARSATSQRKLQVVVRTEQARLVLIVLQLSRTSHRFGSPVLRGSSASLLCRCIGNEER